MPRICTVCSNPSRDVINSALVSGQSIREIAGQHRISKSAVDRHKAEHLPATIVLAKNASNEVQADNLLAKIRALEVKAQGIARKAESDGDLRTALAGIRELTRIVELEGRLAGELVEAPTVNVMIGSEWANVRAQILSALEAYPEARQAVIRSLTGARENG